MHWVLSMLLWLISPFLWIYSVRINVRAHSSASLLNKFVIDAKEDHARVHWSKRKKRALEMHFKVRFLHDMTLALAIDWGTQMNLCILLPIKFYALSIRTSSQSVYKKIQTNTWTYLRIETIVKYKVARLFNVLKSKRKPNKSTNNNKI